MATQEIINIGALPNDGQGDPLRVAFSKVNNNFTSLFGTTSNTASFYTTTGAADQAIYEVPVSQFTQATFQVRTSVPGTEDSQDIVISAQITNNLNGVRFSAYGTTFNGNALARYNMDVSSGNVRLLVSPLQAQMQFHFISALVTFTNAAAPGLDIELNGYPANSFMSTEANLIITTQGTP